MEPECRPILLTAVQRFFVPAIAGPEAVVLLHTQLSMKFRLLFNIQIVVTNGIFGLNYQSHSFFLLINFKMPKNFNIYEEEKLHAQYIALIEHETKV